MKRIRVVADPAFDAMGNAFRYATWLTVVTAKGECHVRETLHRPGSPEAPLDDDQLEAKFDSLVHGILGAKARDDIKAGVRTLDALPSLEPLIANLRA